MGPVGWSILGVAIGGAAAYAGVRVFAGYREPGPRIGLLAPREVGFVEAAALAMFPSGGAVAPSGLEAGILEYVDRYTSRLTPSLRRLLRLLFVAVEHATLVFPAPGPGGRRRFSKLTPEQRVAVLLGWQRSRLFARRLAFTSLRAVLTMGYFADPAVLRELRLAPFTIETPVCEADLLFPRIGERPEGIGLTRDDLTPPSDGTPVPLDTPLDPRYREAR